jgi:anthranilate synthase component 1
MSVSFDVKDLERFAREGYTRVPIVRELLADMETPLSAYRKLANRRYTYLFESVEGGERWGRYSMIGLAAQEVVSISGNQVQRQGEGVNETIEVADPIDWLKDYADQFHAPSLADLPRCNGGLVGFFSYDAVRYFEPRLGAAPGHDEIGAPDILLMRSETLVVFDNLRGCVFLVVHVAPEGGAAALASAAEQLDAIEQQLRQPLAEEFQEQHQPVTEADFTYAMPEQRHAEVVEKIREYVKAGDVMQVVPSQRMSCDYAGRPLDIYRALRYLNPSPYMFFLDLGDLFIAGSSPEILTRIQQRKVTVRPLAGTRRRGRTEEEDLALEAELLADPKEIAEHLMLIDLGRNDIGRICEAGTVKVTDQMVVERYSHVMHISSNVEGELRQGINPLDVMAATFPAGTLSGAPKIRAMEIIDEVEPVKRGIYGGTVGYIDFNGNMDMAIAIRTAVMKNRRLYLQAGGGIVADSIPRLEWKETLNKGRAVFKAVNLALSGLAIATVGDDGSAK